MPRYFGVWPEKSSCIRTPRAGPARISVSFTPRNPIALLIAIFTRRPALTRRDYRAAGPAPRVFMPEGHLVKLLVPLAALVAVVFIGCGGTEPFGGRPGPPPLKTEFGFNEDINVRDYEQQASLGM